MPKIFQIQAGHCSGSLLVEHHLTSFQAHHDPKIYGYLEWELHNFKAPYFECSDFQPYLLRFFADRKHEKLNGIKTQEGHKIQ